MSETGRDDGAQIMPDLEPDLIEPDQGSGGKDTVGRGSIVTLTTVIALLLATGLTVLGIGAADNAVANYDASSWVFSSNKGEVDRVNGVTARVDTRTKVRDAQNHELVVTQTDRYLILRDLQTGQVSAIDLTTLQVSAVMTTTPGLGVSVALHGDTAFVIDSVQGQVRQLDPRTLTPTGEPITLPNGIQPGGFDGKGTMWIAVPTEGTVVGIVAGTGGAGPKVLQTVTVANPGHDLVLSALDEGVAVLDNTDQALLTVKSNAAKTRTAVPVDQPAVMPTRNTGSAIPITIANDRKVVVVDGSKITSFTVPGSGALSPAVSFAGRIYVADAPAGIVYEIETSGHIVARIQIPSSGGAIELEVREGHLFINAPNGSAARVVDDKHNVKDVNKYEDGVLGADPPPLPPPTTPPAPLKTVPGKPQTVTATAGDASATVSWRRAAENGSAITKYVVEGGGPAVQVGAKQLSAQITGLVNGQTYTFTVYAVNAVGAGPKASSPPVTPTADVPQPPASVTAKANPDGTVDVDWPAADGGGRKIILYHVISISSGTETPAGDVQGTTIKIAKAAVTMGTQYAYKVTAINDKNASSKPSPTSNTVVPYSPPGAPKSIAAAPVNNQRGAIRVSWQPADDNGRPIQKYVIDGGNGPVDVTGTSTILTGYGDDAVVTAKVHAVNAAGAGPDATTSARTIGVPTLTLTNSSSALNSVTVTFTPNNKGGAATCTLQISGAGSASAGCTTTPVTLTVGGLWPNSNYGFTVSVATAAGTGSATGAQATPTVNFVVICPNNTGGYCNSGIWAYKTPSQSGTAASPSLSVGTTGTPECYTTGDRVINAQPWGGKSSDQWVRFTYRGATAYFPWAWADLGGGAALGNLPGC